MEYIGLNSESCKRADRNDRMEALRQSNRKYSVIILRVSPRGRGGQTPRASRGGHPVLREEDIPRSCYACNFGQRAISRGV